MEIRRVRTYEGRNIFSFQPVIAIDVDLEELAETATDQLPEFTARLLSVVPGLHEHHCSLGRPGGFVERLYEGTYLGHVLEHLILELQSMAGHSINYGKTRQVEGSVYRVVFRYQSKKAAHFLAKEAVRVLNCLLKGEDCPLEPLVEQARRLSIQDTLGPSTAAIVDAAKARNIPVMRIGEQSLLQLGYGKKQKRVQATMTGNTSCIATDIACDKNLTKEVLQRAGIPVPDGALAWDQEQAVSIAQDLGFPVVVKPMDGNQGKGVTLNLTSEDEVRAAFQVATNYAPQVIVEKYIEGKHYRILVVDGKVVAASQRIPAHVIGDGVHTVQELVEIENKNPLRGEEHEKPLTKIKVDPVVLMVLAKQGMTMSSVPEQGQRIFLRQNANLSTGGIAIDVTDEMHPENRDLFIRVARNIGLDVAGIDIVAPNISLPLLHNGGAVIEVNAAPGIRMHHYPTKGKPRDAAKAIVDMLYPEGDGRIPIIAITGTNGKTTTTRLISHIFSPNYCVGMTTTDGVYIGGKCILPGDNTGPLSARAVLCDPDVEIAVLETARGGILRGGLAYDWCDVGIITNITEDHLGDDGIYDLEDLAYVKSLVVETVKKNGYAVLNADDPVVCNLRKWVDANIIYFSSRETNPLVLAHLAAGGVGVFCRDGYIYIAQGKKQVRLLSVQEIPIALGGAAKHNVENALAAVAGAFGAGASLSMIKHGLLTFKDNPGRLNIIPFKDFKVVVDYGHNPAGFTSVLETLRQMEHKRLVGVVTVPGDRPDEAIYQSGRIAGEGFHHVIIKEDEDLRGRNAGEIASLLQRGALEGGIHPERVETVLDEQAAVTKALNDAQPGDVIVVFYEKFGKVMEAINLFQEKMQCSHIPAPIMPRNLPVINGYIN